jgi:hypothetical protein
MLLNYPVDFLQSSHSPGEQLAGELAHCLRLLVHIPERSLDLAGRQFADVELIQHLEGAFTRNSSKSHFVLWIQSGNTVKDQILDLFENLDHLDGGHGSLESFVARLETGSVDRLFHGIAGQHSIDYRNLGFQPDVANLFGYSG